MRLDLLLLLLLEKIASVRPSFVVASDDLTDSMPFDVASDGYANLKEGKRLFQLQRYSEASAYFWRAVLLQETAKTKVS